MKTNYQDLIIIVDTLSLIQGVLFGGFFIYKSKKNKAHLFFGLFILTYSLELVSSLFENLNLLKPYPKLEYLPLDFYYLTLPFFYIYVKKVSVLNSQKVNYKILILGILEILIGLVLVIAKTNGLLFNSVEYLWMLFILLFIPYNIYVAFLIIRLINKHTKQMVCQYSNSSKFGLQWCKHIAFVLLIFLIIQMILLVPILMHKQVQLIDLTITIINMIVIYWMSIKGLEQTTIQSLININNNSREKHTVIIDDVEISMIKEKFKIIDKTITKEELYKNVDLTILDISLIVNIHSKKISQAINLLTNRNFNNYINSFRVKESKRMLKDSKYNNLSIDGIGRESGFNSKSAFYKAFKEFEGLTPGDYREKNNEI